MNAEFSDDKYEVLEVEEVDENSYAYAMIIWDLNEADHNKGYKLALENSVGKQEYSFEIDVNGVNPGGNGPENGIPKKNMKLAILVVGKFVISNSTCFNRFESDFSPPYDHFWPIFVGSFGLFFF